MPTPPHLPAEHQACGEIGCHGQTLAARLLSRPSNIQDHSRRPQGPRQGRMPQLNLAAALGTPPRLERASFHSACSYTASADRSHGEQVLCAGLGAAKTLLAEEAGGWL